jgi:N6-L-threonylcarbamoyladenine synthase
VKETFVLGIETSCDETAAAVVKDGVDILSNVVFSQDIHAQYGGVVPELASRDHVKNVIPVVKRSIEEAGIGLSGIHGIAVTQGPGLIGSLLVGLSFAKSLSYSLGIPLLAVNHLEGHLYANFLTHPEMCTPILGLIVSGGHTDLLLIEERGNYRLLGETVDDACGEAFDKVGNLLGFQYPGGPEVEKTALKGDPKSVPFPVGRMKGYDFSFSGLKTAVLYYLKKLCEEERESQKADIAASFQHTAIEMLLKKSRKTIRDFNIPRIAISGGVSANGYLRERFLKVSKKEGFDVFFPSRSLCTDNAAMIAACGCDHFTRGDFSPLSIKAEPTETIYKSS